MLRVFRKFIIITAIVLISVVVLGVLAFFVYMLYASGSIFAHGISR